MEARESMATIHGIGAARRRQPSVLVVEEQRLLVWDIAEILASQGFRCVPAPDGVAAATLLARRPTGFAAAMVDLPWPQAPSGQRTVRRLRALCPGLPVIVTSAFGVRTRDADLRGLGGPTARLHKPFSAEELLAALDDVLTAPLLRARRRRRFQGYDSVPQLHDA